MVILFQNALKVVCHVDEVEQVEHVDGEEERVVADDEDNIKQGPLERHFPRYQLFSHPAQLDNNENNIDEVEAEYNLLN